MVEFSDQLYYAVQTVNENKKMSTTDANNVLPPAPPNLCFNKDEFIKVRRGFVLFNEQLHLFNEVHWFIIIYYILFKYQHQSIDLKLSKLDEDEKNSQIKHKTIQKPDVLYVFIFIDMLKTVDESLFLYILSISQLPVTVLGYYFHSVPQFSP